MLNNSTNCLYNSMEEYDNFFEEDFEYLDEGHIPQKPESEWFEDDSFEI